MLERVLEMANSIPPVDNKASRFGNPAFRTFYDKVQEVSCAIYWTCMLLISVTDRPRTSSHTTESTGGSHSRNISLLRRIVGK